ncbi:MAG: RidA family protein [Candidatus Lokiarchaeota archaeon]|nr:RidA family protein [Candidatus Lokiarchaeota archaeon]
MTDSEIINPGTPVAGPYTPGIKVGNLLFISGQGPAQGAIDIKEQTTTTLEKIKKIVEAAGGKMSNIVNTTVYLKNIKDFSEMNRSYKEFFEGNGVTEKFPARATLEVSNLPLETMLREVSAIAVL